MENHHAINGKTHYLVGLPSGKRLHNYGKIHHAMNGEIHYFDWATFNSHVKLPKGSGFI